MSSHRNRPRFHPVSAARRTALPLVLVLALTGSTEGQTPSLSSSSLPVLFREGQTLAVLAPEGSSGGAEPAVQPLALYSVPESLGHLEIRPLGEPSRPTGWVATGTFTQAGQRHLYVLVQERDGPISRLAPPPAREGKLRQEPVALDSGGRIVGLAWLEGASRSRLGVRAATWSQDGWGDVVEVSPPGAGSQLALSGAAMRDGTWLLAWSSFDGSDDEILFSQRREDVWSRPQRVHADNAVPDITPALVAYGSGARLAWSRFDGADYRVLLATFRYRSWSETTIGEPGSVLPRFPHAGGGAQILYRSVQPYGWTLIEVDATAIPRRRAQFPDLVAGDREVPRVITDAARVSVEWPLRGKRMERIWEPLP